MEVQSSIEFIKGDNISPQRQEKVESEKNNNFQGTNSEQFFEQLLDINKLESNDLKRGDNQTVNQKVGNPMISTFNPPKVMNTPKEKQKTEVFITPPKKVSNQKHDKNIQYIFDFMIENDLQVEDDSKREQSVYYVKQKNKEMAKRAQLIMNRINMAIEKEKSQKAKVAQAIHRQAQIQEIKSIQKQKREIAEKKANEILEVPFTNPLAQERMLQIQQSRFNNIQQNQNEMKRMKEILKVCSAQRQKQEKICMEHRKQKVGEVQEQKYRAKVSKLDLIENRSENVKEWQQMELDRELKQIQDRMRIILKLERIEKAQQEKVKIAEEQSNFSYQQLSEGKPATLPKISPVKKYVLEQNTQGKLKIKKQYPSDNQRSLKLKSIRQPIFDE